MKKLDDVAHAWAVLKMTDTEAAAAKASHKKAIALLRERGYSDGNIESKLFAAGHAREFVRSLIPKYS